MCVCVCVFMRSVYLCMSVFLYVVFFWVDVFLYSSVCGRVTLLYMCVRVHLILRACMREGMTFNVCISKCIYLLAFPVSTPIPTLQNEAN